MKYLYLNDAKVADACKLYGVDTSDGVRVIFDVIPRSFGCRLVRYELHTSPFGDTFGRWVLKPIIEGAK